MNPKIPEAKFKEIQWSFRWFSVIQGRTIIIESSFCNSSAKTIARSNESGAITETVWEEEESEEFKDSEPVREKKEESQLISGFQSQNQQQNQGRRIPKAQDRISEPKPGEKSKKLTTFVRMNISEAKST